MKREALEQVVRTLDGMIAAMEQAMLTSVRTRKEREAYELLVAARLKLREELEARERQKP